jgi:class 3 adenylate cyclase
MDLGGWLRSLGLDRYEAAFRANAIDADVLCDLTDQDLEKLGVLLGHRRRILRAIAALDDTLAPATAPQAIPSPTAREQEPTVATLETHFDAPASGEGGPVTVMFCSVVDSSGSSPDPDAEEWHDLVGAFLQAASIAVTEWDGKICGKVDDGLIAHFGYSTQESDLERAINAARVIQRSVAELNRIGDGKPALAARIVIESGPTVVDRGGHSSGELSNLAMRPPTVAEQNPLLFARQRPQIAAPEEHHSRTPKVGRSRTLSDGRPMNYHQLITRAINALDKNTGEARRALYERARNALIAQLRSNHPVLVLADITKERLALEEAIRKVEAEAARNSRTEPRTEKQELRSVAPVGTRDVDGRSVPPWRDHPNPSSSHLPGDQRSPVLLSAGDRLLSARPSTKKQALNPLSDMVGNVRDVGPAAVQTARQKRDPIAPETLRHQVVEESIHFSGEAHADLNELNSNDDDPLQQRGQASAETYPVVLRARYTRSALQMRNDPTRRHQFSSPRRSSLPSANWSLPLPRPLVVSGVIVATLNDARVLIERHSQGDSHAKEMWRYVSNELRQAALGATWRNFHQFWRWLSR